jgi:hypothetical protein
MIFTLPNVLFGLERFGGNGPAFGRFLVVEAILGENCSI